MKVLRAELGFCLQGQMQQNATTAPGRPDWRELTQIALGPEPVEKEDRPQPEVRKIVKDLIP